VEYHKFCLLLRRWYDDVSVQDVTSFSRDHVIVQGMTSYPYGHVTVQDVTSRPSGGTLHRSNYTLCLSSSRACLAFFALKPSWYSESEPNSSLLSLLTHVFAVFSESDSSA